MAATKKGDPIKKQLLNLLPKVLPKSPTDAITGTTLIAALRKAGLKDSTENSLRSWISSFAKDPTSPIAKVAKGNGYFLRPEEDRGEVGGLASGLLAESADDKGTRDSQLEEKFRAIFMKWCESQNELPVLLNHSEAAKKAKGINKWKYPDVLSTRWNVWDQGSGEDFDSNSLDVMIALGEAPFELVSTELKVELKPSNLRQSFFQCVSNSKWAHVAQLVVACDIADDNVERELARLGPSYDVSVLSFGLSEKILKGLPPANKIRTMSGKEADDLLQKISVKVVATGDTEEALDWEQLRDLQKQHEGISDILEWISRCLKDKQPHPFDVWEENLRKGKKRR